jgi:hypothetical protein
LINTEEKTGRYLRKVEHRKFLDQFAKNMNFDPLDAEKWYFVTQKELSKAVSMRKIFGVWQFVMNPFY